MTGLSKESLITQWIATQEAQAYAFAVYYRVHCNGRACSREPNPHVKCCPECPNR